jgi:hypothetical protein
MRGPAGPGGSGAISGGRVPGHAQRAAPERREGPEDEAPCPGPESHARTMVSVVARLGVVELVGCPRARSGVASGQYRKVDLMIALLLLLLIIAVFGGLGFMVHALWFVLIAAVILWAIAFFMGSLGGGRRHGFR